MVSSGLLVLTRATWRNNPEDTILHSHRRENLKSYRIFVSSQRQKVMTDNNADKILVGTILTVLQAGKHSDWLLTIW
jgi:hypothetical protein